VLSVLIFRSSSSKDSIIYANIEISKFYVTIQSEYNEGKCEIPFNESSLSALSVGKKSKFDKTMVYVLGYIQIHLFLKH